MELYDETSEQKKSKAPMIIGITIAILVVITILIVIGIIYLKNSITTINIDGVRNTEIEKIFYIENNEEGSQLYLPIIKTAEFFGYEGFTGDYKDKSEDKTKCHATSKNEIAMFTKDSDILLKITNDSEIEYIKLDKPVFEKNGELYTTVQGIEKAYNILFSSDEKYKNVNIYSMEYLINYYAKLLKKEKYSTVFSDQKAIFENMLIVEENNQYGVINIATKQYVLEAKYDEIRFLPATTEFLVKSNGKYGIVAIRENEIITKIKTTYDEIKTIDNRIGLYLVKQNNVYGVMNVNGDVIIEPEYKQIGINSNGYIQNGVENHFILFDEILPVQSTEGLWGFYNIKGEKITEFKYSGVGCQTSPIGNTYPVLIIPTHKIIVVQKDKKYNLITSDGEELISGSSIGAVYLKQNTATGENQYFMTSSNNEKVMNIEEWLTSIGR